MQDIQRWIVSFSFPSLIPCSISLSFSLSFFSLHCRIQFHASPQPSPLSRGASQLVRYSLVETSESVLRSVINDACRRRRVLVLVLVLSAWSGNCLVFPRKGRIGGIRIEGRFNQVLRQIDLDRFLSYVYFIESHCCHRTPFPGVLQYSAS